MTESSLRLDHQLCHRFYTASNAFTRAYRPLLKPLNLTYPQYIVLMGLWEQDKISILELIKQTQIDGGSLSLILDKLKAKGLLNISPSAQDKRKRIIQLTPQGVKLKTQAIKIPGLMWCKMNNLTEQEALTLIQLIDKVNLDLKSAQKPE